MFRPVRILNPKRLFVRRRIACWSIPQWLGLGASALRATPWNSLSGEDQAEGPHSNPEMAITAAVAAIVAYSRIPCRSVGGVCAIAGGRTLPRRCSHQPPVIGR